MTLLRLAERLLALVRAIFAGAIIVLFAFMVIAVMVQVTGRYVFNFPIAGADETATMAQIWMVMLGAGYAMRKGLHVGVDVLVALLPPLALRAVNLLVTALALWFLWIVFDGSFRLIQIGRIQTSPALLIPMVYPYLVIPIGTAYFAFELVMAMAPRIFGPDARVAAGAAGGGGE